MNVATENRTRVAKYSTLFNLVLNLMFMGGIAIVMDRMIDPYPIKWLLTLSAWAVIVIIIQRRQNILETLAAEADRYAIKRQERLDKMMEDNQ